MSVRRSPESETEMGPAYPYGVPAHWQRFFDLRDDMLLEHSHDPLWTQGIL